MKTNDDKCHLVLSSSEEGEEFLQIENSTIKCSIVKKLLGTHIDYKLKFDTLVENIFEESHRKLNALSRITNCKELTKRGILINTIFKVFNYWAIISMLHSHCSNMTINRFSGRCLGIICNDKISKSFGL